MSITKTTAEDENWLDSQITLVSDEIIIKHKKMACGVFEFLRATFYRWAYLLLGLC